MPSEEISLIQRAQKGDALALARLHDQYCRCAYRYFYYRVDDEQLVEDLTAGLFIRMGERISLFKPESGSFQAWLYSLARSLMLEELLKRGIPYQKSSLSTARAIWGQPAVWFKHSLALLSPAERDVIVGKLVEKRPAKAVGREIGHAVHITLALQLSALTKLAQIDQADEQTEEREKDIARQLEEAILFSRNGQPVDSILIHYPESAEILAPLLIKAREILDMPNPEPPSQALAASKSQMMESLDRKKTLGAQHKEDVMGHLGLGIRKKPGRKLVAAILILSVIFILLSSLIVSAIYALPGSWLYPAKLRLEETHILVTFDPIAKAKLAAYYERLRVEDFQTAVELGRLTATEAQATMTAMPTATPISQ